MKVKVLAAIVVIAISAEVAPAAIRVALMDFATDDNSYRSVQQAADFSSELQACLADEPGVEWVEREQLDQARQEVDLAVAGFLDGSIQRGKWAKADWMIRGLFSSNDRNQRTLSLEITDLQHADTLANGTVVFPGPMQAPPLTDTNLVHLAAQTLRPLLVQAQQRRKQMTDKILVAPLFFVDVSGVFSFNDNGSLESSFQEALDKTAAAHQQICLIRFPKACQSIKESEMILDGLVEADNHAWQNVADLYVWGTHQTIRSLSPGKRKNEGEEITVCSWDGATPLVTIREVLPSSTPPDQIQATFIRLANQIIQHAHKQPPARDEEAEAVRINIAQSLVQTYDRMTMEHGFRLELELNDPKKFLAAAHLLETACFFDPDNANARMLYITCRWGWWLDFDFNVKSQFWSRWRASQAWGSFVDRFGFKSVAETLPFPYEQRGVPAEYVESLQAVIELFPQNFLSEETERAEQQQGTHTALIEAELHGFPTDMPPKLAQSWKQKLKAELAQRRQKVQSFQTVSPFPKPPANSLLANTPSPAPTNQPTGTWPNIPEWVPAPAWLDQIRPGLPLFRLSPPEVRPHKVAAALQKIVFPNQFKVQSVIQLGFLGEDLFILAKDERSAPSSEVNSEVESELIHKRQRLWVLKSGTDKPVLLAPEQLRQNVRAFLLKDNRLWLAGEVTGYLDLSNQSIHAFGFKEGLPSRESGSIGMAHDCIFACDCSLNGFRYEPISGRWVGLPKPNQCGWLGEAAYFFASNDRWICFGQNSGNTLFYSLATNTQPNIQQAECIAAESNGFWLGKRQGLEFYDPSSGASQRWDAPQMVQGMDVPGFSSHSEGRILKKNLTEIDEATQGATRKFYRNHIMTLKARTNRDPLHLQWRVPDDIEALAKDGDFLWLGAGNYLFLLHQPTTNLVACQEIPVHGSITTIAPTPTSVWIGTDYDENPLICLQKNAFLSVSKEQWLSLAITPAEREQLIASLGKRDQALYAFYEGEDANVARLLGKLDPQTASLETLLMLIFACSTTGVDDANTMQLWATRLNERFPDSPWGKVVSEMVAEYLQSRKEKQHATALLTRYDLNHDGILDEQETKAMKKDPAYQREEQQWENGQIDMLAQEIMKKYDHNGDGRLDKEDLDFLHSQVVMLSDASPDLLKTKKLVIRPLLSKNFPTAAELLKKYGNKEGTLDLAALKVLLQETKPTAGSR